MCLLGEYSIGNAYYSTNAETYTPKLISRLESLVEEVYKNGGRKFLFLNVPPTSRSPLFLEQGEEVVKQHAEYLSVYNENLEGMVDDFTKKKGDVSFFLSCSLYFSVLGYLCVYMCGLEGKLIDDWDR